MHNSLLHRVKICLLAREDVYYAVIGNDWNEGVYKYPDVTLIA